MRWITWPSRVGALCVVLVAAAPSMAQQKKVLFLVNNRESPINFDPALKLHLEWVHGAEVTLEQPETFDTQGLDELAREFDLVLISESLGSTSVLDADANNEFKLQNTPVPVMSFEAYMWEDAFWTELPQFDKFGNTGRTDLIDSALAAGLDAPQSDFYITATGAQHPMGAGFPEGALTIYNLLYSVNFGTPSADAKVIATADAAGEFPSHFVYETGDQLVDGSVAPAARIGLYVGQAANPNANFAPLPEFFNDAAWALLDAAFEFTMGPRPTPGDVNLDGTIDLADFAIISEQFMTEGMTRADVNHDMKVDFADFGLWKVNFLASAETPASVPEPASLGLLVLGWLGLFVLRPFGRPRRR